MECPLFNTTVVSGNVSIVDLIACNKSSTRNNLGGGNVTFDNNSVICNLNKLDLNNCCVCVKSNNSSLVGILIDRSVDRTFTNTTAHHINQIAHHTHHSAPHMCGYTPVIQPFTIFLPSTDCSGCG